MNWTSMVDFFSMGGYALYVWGSYAMAVLLMVGEPLLVRRQLGLGTATRRAGAS